MLGKFAAINYFLSFPYFLLTVYVANLPRIFMRIGGHMFVVKSTLSTLLDHKFNMILTMYYFTFYTCFSV